MRRRSGWLTRGCSRSDAELFDRDNGAYRFPLIELRPEYVNVPRTLSESVEACGAPVELGAFASAGVIPAGIRLYTHQERALRAGMTLAAIW